MNTYIKNVNTYISQMKIKQTYISMKTGIDASKLSRILKGIQDITSSDMEKIANSLGKHVAFFVNEDMQLVQSEDTLGTQAVFYAGSPGIEQEEFALDLVELIENVDEILGAKARYMMTIEE